MNSPTVRLLAETDFAWCSDKYVHIWNGIEQLSKADPRMGVVIECAGIPPGIAQKKAHTYARRFGLVLMCKTRVGVNGRQLFVRRRPIGVMGDTEKMPRRLDLIDSMLTMGYSSRCSENYHAKCKGVRNKGARIACNCPCHIKERTQ